MSQLDVAVNIEDVSPVQKKISFEIPWTDVSQELDLVYEKVGKTARIKGFRPGKIPRKILESFYKDHAEDEAISNLINKVYWDAIKDNEVEAVAQPVIDQKGIEHEKNFSFTATVEVEPVIEPKDYVGLELEKEESEVTESDVDARIQQIREMFATVEEISEDRGVRIGDFATLDFEGFKEGKPVKDTKSKDYFIEIGSGKLVPGFEEQIAGMKKGEHKQITVKFPDDYPKEGMAGKDITFEVDLKGLHEKKLPDINEEFIKNFEKYDSLESFRQDARKSLEETKKAESESQLKESIISKLLAINEFDVPQSFIERQIFMMMADTQSKLEARGMQRKEAAQMSFKYRDMFKEDAKNIVKSYLLIKRIAEKESLFVSDQDVEDRIKKIAEDRNVTYDKVKESMDKEEVKENMKLDILHDKVFEFIKDKANIKVVVKKSEPALDKEK